MSDNGEVRISHTRLQRVRRQAGTAQDQLLAVAQVVFDELGLGALDEDNVEIRVRPNNTRVIVISNETCGVYEDPPGICRPCTAEEQ
ncbi:MAG: hypothetical protein QOE59_3923 [Actinomycetota bacterium]|jgi:hypothetical protein|nr:hypothetical protein [Actinomycetota bacterium]